MTQLVDEPGFLVLSEGSGDLAHHLAAGIVACRQIVSAGGQKAHPAIDEQRDAEFLGHQLTSEAGGVLDDDRADAVVFDPVEKLGEARPILDRVRARNRRIVKLGDDLEAAPLGEAFDGVAWSFFAVLVGPTLAAELVL